MKKLKEMVEAMLTVLGIAFVGATVIAVIAFLFWLDRVRFVY